MIGSGEASTTGAGVVVLHDARLQHLFGGLYLMKRKSRAEFVKIMQATYGVSGEAAANLMSDGRVSPEEVAEQFPLVELALRGAIGAVVHSAEAERIVRARVDIPVLKLNLPYAAGPPCERRPARHASDPIRVVAFGHIGPNRRIESVLSALALTIPISPMHFDLIGDVSNERLLRDKAQQLGISRFVTFHGYLADGALDRHLCQADLVINLRWPTMGEASYSQLRSFGHGIATMVTRSGWYADIPEDVVIHIDPEREIEEIAAVFAKSRSMQDKLRELGDRGRQLLLRDHSPETYVAQLVQFALSLSGSTRPAEEALASTVARTLAIMPADSIGPMLSTLGQRLSGRLHRAPGELKPEPAMDGAWPTTHRHDTIA